MQVQTRNLLEKYIAERDIEALDEILNNLNGGVDRYLAVESFLNEHAQQLANHYGYVLQPGRFMFQELVYLREREALSPMVMSAVKENDFSFIERYLQERNTLRAFMLVFELLCINRQLKQTSKKVAYWLHYCMQRLYAKRDVALLLEMVYEAYPEKKFRRFFFQYLVNCLDVDFLYFHGDAQAVLLTLKYDPEALQFLDAQKRTLLLPFLLQQFPLAVVLEEYAWSVIGALETASLAWFYNLDWSVITDRELEQLSLFIVRYLTDWDVLLVGKWPERLYKALLLALDRERAKMGTEFYKELKGQIESVL